MTNTGGKKRRGREVVPVLLLLAFVAIRRVAAQDSEDWANSPEAYFLTAEERSEWNKLDSRDSRQAFKERYWLRRDPTPGTEKNEFRELVLGRIKIADERFRIEKTPGSRTARGLVFIVLGSPARVQDDATPRPLPDPAGGRRLGERVTPVAVFEGNETTSTWSYDRDRTPRILEAIARPSLTIKIVVEPSRHKDSIQDPGLFNDIRALISRRSIVNPDLVPASAAVRAPSSGAPALLRQTLAAAVRQALEAAPAASRRDGAAAGSAVVFRASGDPETLLWVFASAAGQRPVFHALVRAADGTEIVSLTEPATISGGFSTRTQGVVALKRLTLPPGSYTASIGLGEGEGKLLASATLPIQVPALDREFAVSSLILTRGPARAASNADPLFAFAGTLLPPRGDASFATSESLWYFVEIANPSDPAKVMLEPRLRRGGEPVGALPAFPAKLQPIGAGRYLAGVELPLGSLSPGEYLLYLAVADGEGEGRPKALRRADFQVVP